GRGPPVQHDLGDRLEGRAVRLRGGETPRLVLHGRSPGAVRTPAGRPRPPWPSVIPPGILRTGRDSQRRTVEQREFATPVAAAARQLLAAILAARTPGDRS